MDWLTFILQMLLPLWIAVYTFNFGRWMHKRDDRAGSWGAYLFAVLALGISGWVVLRNGT
jgi:fumarate reductase subunit D